jgi:uncharacterized membrane protein YczE
MVSTPKLHILRGELALAVVVVINTFSVVLMLHAGAGVSTISSVPLALSEVMPFLSLGTWTYLLHGALVLTLILLRRKIPISYLLSFVVGFCFGKMIDVHELWVYFLPRNLPLCVLYFLLSYLLLSFGISLSNRCKMPIIPTDLFPRDLAIITGVRYARIKIGVDVTCVLTSALLTLTVLGDIRGLGIGTVITALTMGKAVELWGIWIDRHFTFVSALEKWS